MREADLFVVTGMGGLTSAFPGYAAMVVDTLALAQAIGVPTVLFGQGIGPFDVLDARLEARTRNVLRRANYIGLREGQHGPELLRSWGIPPERWSVTGDDALELAIPYRSDRERHAIGVNVRKANYSAVSLDVIAGLREPLQHAAASIAAPLRAIPISRLPEEDDARQIESLFLGYNAVEHPESALDSPNRIMEQIQHCRVVVTGSYHAGVFALAQGIPVIGLAANDYYQWKFDGLAHQFGDGCGVLRLGTPGSFARLRHMIVQLFQAAPTLRSALLASADRQVDAGKAAYEHVRSLVDRRRAGTPCKSP
jgi:colanic acid/amylovoran biosynthesis protein